VAGLTHNDQAHFELLLPQLIFLMKKTSIILLVLIAGAIAALMSYMGNLSTTETIASAIQKPGKTVSLSVAIAPNSLHYDPVKNPNYLTFTAIDSLGNKMPVAYYYEKPYDMEKSEKVTIKGRYENGVFQIREQRGILVKCPSKYKDDMDKAKEKLETSSR
jgi:hypothetical protein